MEREFGLNYGLSPFEVRRAQLLNNFLIKFVLVFFDNTHIKIPLNKETKLLCFRNPWSSPVPKPRAESQKRVAHIAPLLWSRQYFLFASDSIGNVTRGEVTLENNRLTHAIAR